MDQVRRQHLEEPFQGHSRGRDRKHEVEAVHADARVAADGMGIDLSLRSDGDLQLTEMRRPSVPRRQAQELIDRLGGLFRGQAPSIPSIAQPDRA